MVSKVVIFRQGQWRDEAEAGFIPLSVRSSSFNVRCPLGGPSSVVVIEVAVSEAAMAHSVALERELEDLWRLDYCKEQLEDAQDGQCLSSFQRIAAKLLGVVEK